MFDDEHDEEDLVNIRGGSSKKPKMAVLNQKNVSKWEMDELFADEDGYDEEF